MFTGKLANMHALTIAHVHHTAWAGGNNTCVNLNIYTYILYICVKPVYNGLTRMSATYTSYTECHNQNNTRTTKVWLCKFIKNNASIQIKALVRYQIILYKYVEVITKHSQKFDLLFDSILTTAILMRSSTRFWVYRIDHESKVLFKW